MLQLCDRCARYKAKSCAVRKETYTRSSQLGDITFADRTGTFTESLIGNWYWIGLVDNYSCYSWSLFMNTKSQLTKKTEEFFENMTSGGTLVK